MNKKAIFQNKKIIFPIVLLLVISIIAICAENSPSPKEKKVTKDEILKEIQETYCSTPSEFAKLIVEIRNAIGSFDELKTSSPFKGEHSDVTIELRKNKSVVKYLEAPFKDNIPELLHSEGLTAKDISDLYYAVLEGKTNIDRYAVNGVYPLCTYATTYNLPTKNEIIDQMKRDGGLRNPESLQVHSVSYYLYGDLDKQVKDNISSASRIGTILVDYSAQNGFGGYDRTFASFEIYSSLYCSIDSMKLNNGAVEFIKSLKSVSPYWKPTWNR